MSTVYTKITLSSRNATRILLWEGIKNGKKLWRHFDDVYYCSKNDSYNDVRYDVM